MWKKIKAFFKTNQSIEQDIEKELTPEQPIIKPKKATHKKKKKKRVKIIKQKEIQIIKVPVEKEDPKEYVKEIDGKPIDGRELLPENTLSSYTELVNFIQHIPGSFVGNPISRYFYQDNINDDRVESVLGADAAMWIMNKYQMTIKDRKNLISAIINTKILND